MEISELHKLVIERLRNGSVEDLITGDVYIPKRKLRVLLGQRCSIPKRLHVRLIKELKELGVLERINRDNYKLKKDFG